MDYIYNPNTNELYHYGVKGMKWGVRKKQYGESFVSTKKDPKLEKYKRDHGINYGGYRRNQSDDLRDAGAIGNMAGKALRKGVQSGAQKVKQRKNASDNSHADYKRAHDKTSVKNMSDKELRERINRLQIEQQYNNLNKRQKSAGEKWATGILVGAATSVASSYANKYAKKGVEWASEKLLDGAANVVGDIIIKQMNRR